jgi:tRNA wybutosine-synthesizing protein 1
MEEEHKKLLTKQHYYITGKNSAVKICSWTKKSIKNEGVCYKEKFYGIKCHRCAQISTTIGYCQNKCLICWRPMEYTKTKKMVVCDNPNEVIENTIKGQKVLLSGLGGFEKTDKKKLKESFEPKHFAISLSGEPFSYPKLEELLIELDNQNKTSFVVTNGMFPNSISKLKKLPTQFYVSVDAPNKELFEQIDNPSLKDGWDRLIKTLKILNKIRDKTRTTLRLTLIKDMNMINPNEWADLITIANPIFVEVKAYMYVGFSRNRLNIENMPRHSEVKAFADKISKYCDYKIIDEQKESRVVLLMKEDFNGRIMNFNYI